MKKSLKFLLGGIGLVGSVGVITPIITSCSFDFQLPKPKPKQKICFINIYSNEINVGVYQGWINFISDDKHWGSEMAIGINDTNNGTYEVYKTNVKLIKEYYSYLQQNEYLFKMWR